MSNYFNNLYQLWDRFFPHVTITKYIPFSICQACADFHMRIMNAKDDQEVKDVNQEREEHKTALRYFRDRLHFRMWLADYFIKFCLFIAVDGMDQRKTQLPSQARPTKDVEGVGEPLQTKLTACLLRNGADQSGFYGAWSLPRQECGSDYTCTVINRLLCLYEDAKKSCTQGYTLPPVLFLQLDNCGKENKNQYLLRYLSLLVHLGVFARIEVHFLHVGHTHAQVDQAISVVARAFRGTEVNNLEQAMRIVDGLFEHFAFRQCELVSDIFDIKGMTNRFCHKLQGLGTVRDPHTQEKVSMHAIRIERTDDDRVVLTYKELDDGNGWFGHWKTNEGLEIFNVPSCSVPIPEFLPGILAYC
jgi:hypothetical protein